MILYRPVGLRELYLIFESGLKVFPPRLPEQPVFYPVLNLEYARQIALDWNTKSEPFAGFVTEFAVDDRYIQQFEPHIVGGHQHVELWIPAERLDEFNQHILRKIKVIEAYFGKAYLGFAGQKAGLKDKDAISQFTWIANTYVDSPQNVSSEIIANPIAIFLNYPFWQRHDFTRDGIDDIRRQKILEAIQQVWSAAFPEVPLGIS